MRYIGVDLHTTNFVTCFMDDQEHVTLQTFALSAKGLAAFRRRLIPEDRVAVEASPGVNFFYEQLRSAVQDEAFDPIDLGLLGLVTVVPEAKDVTNLVQQFGTVSF
jgi:hypothetical protein